MLLFSWAGSMAGSVLPRAGRRVGQEALRRTTAGACTGSCMSGLLSSGPEGKRGADGLARIADTVAVDKGAATLAALAHTRTAVAHPPAAAALRVIAVMYTDVDVVVRPWTDFDVVSDGRGDDDAIGARAAGRPGTAPTGDGRDLRGELHVQSPRGSPGAVRPPPPARAARSRSSGRYVIRQGQQDMARAYIHKRPRVYYELCNKSAPDHSTRQHRYRKRKHGRQDT